MHKSKHVMFVDGLGKEHSALVTAINGLHPGYVTLVYVDESAPDADNLKKVYDIPHMELKPAESNSSLPSYDFNCWKEVDEEHKALPSDHPAFDHPFAGPAKDEEGIPLPRPEYEAELAAHQAKPSADDLDAIAAEDEAKKATNGKKNPKPVAVGK